VSTPRSRYQPAAPPDYSHRFHAGNVGDVWKHCALSAVLRRAAAAAARVTYVETHAGEGGYPLTATGEWSEGIGRLWGLVADADDAVSRYVALCRRLGTGTERPTAYPGSPAFARAVLGPEATLVLHERDEGAHARLAAHTRGDARTRTVCGDGLAALADAIRRAEAEADAVVVLIDPPWTQKADWTLVPDALARAVRGARRTCVVLWYPVKSLTRPNAMTAWLRTVGVAGTIAELVTTPLDERRHRLNGSGVLLVRAPDGTLEDLGAAAPRLGTRCATRDGVWSFRVQSWSAR
jgi:23S rRNA (adenine2030-N6)-methyltransferase